MIAKFYFKNNEIRQQILNKIGLERNGKIRFGGNEIDFVGRSRIDGELMFSADDAIMQKIIKNLTVKGFLIHCDIIHPIEDVIPAYFGIKQKPEKEVKRIYSDIDPYGEEEWDDSDKLIRNGVCGEKRCDNQVT